MTDPLITQKKWNAKLRELRIAKEVLQAYEMQIAQLQRQVAQLSTRLEIVYAYDGNGNKIPFPGWGSDGIACRDATIRLLEEEIARMRKLPSNTLWDGTKIVPDTPSGAT